jgi:putative endonuclease
LKAHNLGKGAKYTRSRRPLELLGVSSKKSRSDALKLEYRIKKTPAKRKLFELVKRETPTDMENTRILQAVRVELHSVVKRIQLLVENVGNLVAAIEKLGEKELSTGTNADRAPSRKKENGVKSPFDAQKKA